ncbi:MAG: hypothetical protein M1813_005402 [Trichoglossum hirsutum]|nr:MAG: hypothetical protein M1813_005402 [Trichoglossum hirsutum]
MGPTDGKHWRPSSSTAYRYQHPANASAYINTNPPNGLRIAINDITGAGVSENRHAKLHKIAQEPYEAYRKQTRGPAYEDDFLDQLHYALRAMNHDNIRFLSKAKWATGASTNCLPVGSECGFSAEFQPNSDLSVRINQQQSLCRAFALASYKRAGKKRSRD